MPAVQWGSWSVVVDRHEAYRADVQKSQVLVATEPDGEAALPTSKGMAVVADLEKPAVGDGQAERPVFGGAVCQGPPVETHVPMLGFLLVGDGFGDPHQAFRSRIPHSLIRFPGLLRALLVNVVRRVGCLPVGLPPGGDALVQSVGVVTPAELGEFGFPVQAANRMVVRSVLLGGVVTYGPTVGSVPLQGEFQRTDDHNSVTW